MNIQSLISPINQEPFRLVFFPKDEIVEFCLENKTSLRSHYPLNSNPSIYVNKTFTFNFHQPVAKCINSIFHALDKIEIVSPNEIYFCSGSVFIAKDISIKANTIVLLDGKISDFQNYNPCMRTSIIAKKNLHLEANRLIIDGIDIPRPENYSIIAETITVSNLVNGNWLCNDLKMHNDLQDIQNQKFLKENKAWVDQVWN